jgi:hypothetical protein
VDIDSFSDASPEVRKEAVPAAAAETTADVEVTVPAEAPGVAEAVAADVALSTRSRNTASPESTKELELTVQRGEDPTEHAPLVEVRKVVPEDQAPSPSLAAFNKSFGTSHRGELLSVGFKTIGVGSKMSKILTLWKSPVIVDETGGEISEQPKELLRTQRKGPTLLPKPPLRLEGKLRPVRRNK